MTGAEAGAADRRPQANVPDSEWLLLLTLQFAVPLVIREIAHLTPEERQQVAPQCGQVIAEHGDDLMYGGKHCAAGFNALAKALGVAAYQPGGVTFRGLHWCVGSSHNGTQDEAPCAAEIAREATETQEGKAAS